MSVDHQLTNDDLHRIYAALASEVKAHSRITPAGQIFRTAGLLPSGDQQHWIPLMQSFDKQFLRFSREGKLRTICILGRQLMQEKRSETRESVKALLREHGFQYVDGVFIPANFFDEREARYLPQSALSEISTALDRLVAGDLDGAVTSACSAIETAAADVYRKAKSLGDIANEKSFQKKAMTAITASCTLQKLEGELVTIGWDPNDAALVRRNLEGALKQAAYVMQSLRPRMGDVHGAKPALEAVVFDAIKLASILVSLMK